MALVLSKKPSILLENDDDYRTVIFEGKTITKSLFADIDNCAEFTKVTIPENVEGVTGDAFEEFVNLREVVICGYVYEVKRSLGGGVTRDINWKKPTVLAEHLRSGCYVEIKRGLSWRDWN
ncbi:MAG: hypothetical protein J6U93_01725 [Alistipes sp.]|nr:hypothetical protein [Alistipes sp.]